MGEPKRTKGGGGPDGTSDGEKVKRRTRDEGPVVVCPDGRRVQVGAPHTVRPVSHSRTLPHRSCFSTTLTSPESYSGFRTRSGEGETSDHRRERQWDPEKRHLDRPKESPQRYKLSWVSE